MGFFSWLGSLLDQFVAWLGRMFMAFFKAFLKLLEGIWTYLIAPVLRAAFGIVNALYVIFYAGTRRLAEVIMEIWDPNHMRKPSQVFKLQKAPSNSPLPERRSDAKVMVLNNSY